MSVCSGIGLLFAALMLSSLAGWSFGQAPPAKPAPATPQLVSPAADPATFLSLQYDETLKKNRTGIFKILTAGRVAPDQEQFFDTYYKRYSMGRWTEPSNYTLLPKFRDELRADLQKTKAGDAHTRITDLIFKGMSQVATSNYHPVVRVNAMLMISDLNSDDTNRDRPVAYHQAVPLFVQVIDDPRQLDAVKAAAFAGLIRHIRLGLRDDVRDSVSASMLSLAKSAAAPGRSPDGHAWLRAEAVEVLGLLGNIGNANAVADTLGQIAGDAGAPMMVRRAAARALGNLNYQVGVSLNGSALAAAVARFMIHAAETAQSDNDQGKPGAARRLRTHVIAAAEGINRLADSLKDATHQKYADSVRKAIAELSKKCERGSDPEILQQAASTAAELRKLTKAS